MVVVVDQDTPHKVGYSSGENRIGVIRCEPLYSPKQHCYELTLFQVVIP